MSVNVLYKTSAKATGGRDGNAATLDDFANARKASFLRRLYLIRRSGVYRQSTLENIGLLVGALFGRL